MADAEATALKIDTPGLPNQVLQTYARLWQLETWLRQMVYVEMRALHGNAWADDIRGALKPKEADKRLTHMPTTEVDVLSYTLFSVLLGAIADHWDLFEPYLPPKSIWQAKLEEVGQIRHRVAHFRRGHEDDLQRVIQLLRDIDRGMWRFCTSYNDAIPVLPQSDDPIVAHFLDLDPLPYGPTADGAWARYGFVGRDVRFSVTINVLVRSWAKWTKPFVGTAGFIYDVMVYARGQQHFNYKALLADFPDVAPHLIHVCLDSARKAFRVTIPAVLGFDIIVHIVNRVIAACQNNVWRGFREPDKLAQMLADASPEYVLGPDNPLTFLGPDMPCSFFGV